MKKITLGLIALLLTLGLCPKAKAEETEDRVCILIKDEKGNVLNEEEYLQCLEETGQKPDDGKWPDDNI